MNPNRWWTWNSERSVELIHLESGLQITPVLYAASKERISLLNPGPEITFGRRPVGDELMQDTNSYCIVLAKAQNNKNHGKHRGPHPPSIS